MRKYRSLAILFVLCMLVFIPVKASENASTVRYRSNGSSTQSFLLEVFGNGSVYDGNQLIKNGSVEYQLRINEEKKFTILPDEGYEITHVYYSVTSKQRGIQTTTQDIKNQMVDNTITIQIVEGEIGLKIEFEKNSKDQPLLPEDVVNQDNSSSNRTASPITGEEGNLLLYSMVMMSYFILFVGWSKARKEYLHRQGV